MNLTTHPKSAPAALAVGVTALCRSRLPTALVAVVLASGRSAAAHRRGRDGSPAAARRSHRRAHRRARSGPERAPAGRRSRLVPRRPARLSTRPKAVYKSALHGKDAVSRSLGSAVVDGHGRDRPRGRGDRSRRRAVSGDRVLPRLDERPDRLRVDARADRGRRVRRGRPWPHEQHAGRPPDRLHQRAGHGGAGVARPAVHVQRHATRPLRQAEHPVQHGRPRPRRHGGARRAGQHGSGAMSTSRARA